MYQKHESTTGSEEKSSDSEKTTSDKQSEEPVTVVYYTWEDTEKTNPIWEDIKKDLNINVEVKSLPDTGGNDKEVALDIVQMGGGDLDFRIVTESSPATRVAKGFLYPLDDLIQKYNVNMKELFGSFADFVVFDGKTYGLPCRANTVMYFYNKDIFDKEGIPYPEEGWTWDEFKALVERLTKGEGSDKQYGYAANSMNMYWAYPAIWSGATWYNEEGYSNIDDPRFVKALKEYHDMDEQGLKPSYSSMRSRNSYISVEFLSGKVAIGQCLGYVVRDMRNKSQFPFDFEVGIVPPPVMEEGASTKATTLGVQMFSINPNSKHIDEAFQAKLYYMQNGAQYVAPFNVPPVANPDEKTLDAFIENTPLSKEDAMKFFDPGNEYHPVTISGTAAAEYISIVNEEADKYLTGGQSLEDTIKNIKTRADEAIDKAKATQ